MSAFSARARLPGRAPLALLAARGADAVRSGRLGPSAPPGLAPLRPAPPRGLPALPASPASLARPADQEVAAASPSAHWLRVRRRCAQGPLGGAAARRGGALAARSRSLSSVARARQRPRSAEPRPEPEHVRPAWDRTFGGRPLPQRAAGATRKPLWPVAWSPGQPRLVSIGPSAAAACGAASLGLEEKKKRLEPEAGLA